MTALRPGIAGDIARAEIDAFQDTVRRYRDKKIEEVVFLEYRLRFGIYGMRQDGVHMMRSKLPLGLLAPDQMRAFADVAERFGNGVAHLTTRQDIQVHFVGLEQTPDLLRVLDDAAMTSREACGNVVRNVTSSPLAGVEPGEPFDVTPYGMTLARALLRHPDGQSLGRKFKITLSGTDDPRFDLSRIHDLGAVARISNGERGFLVRVGGGLGAVPQEALVLGEFVSTSELVPLTLAVLRLFARFGEKKKRARARLKFLVADWGIEKFRDAVLTERAALVDDPAWREVEDLWRDGPRDAPGFMSPPLDEAESTWRLTNVIQQADPNYVTVHVRVPRGDLAPEQLRGLADLLDDEVGDTTRIGADQSLYIRWVSPSSLGTLYRGLEALGLARSGAGGIADPVTCPGADTCKLGITSPRSAARKAEPILDALARDPRLRDLRVHISGCPNACAQHHVADIGFFGAARTVGGVPSPHFMVLLGGFVGGAGEGEAGSGFGSTVGKVPAARVGDAIRALTQAFLDQGIPGEPFGRFARRQTREYWKAILEPLGDIPSFEQDPSYYREPGKDEPFVVRRGTGECAGAPIGYAELLLAEADRFVERAGDPLVAGAPEEDAARAAIDRAVRALLSLDGDAPRDDIVPEFERRWYAPGRVFEGVGHYAIQALTEGPVHGDRLRRLVVEAGLFVEEVHTIIGKTRPAASAEEAT